MTANTVTHIARILVSLAAVLVVTPVMIGALGISGFGVWAIGMTVLTLARVADLGTGNVLMKWIARFRAVGDAHSERRVLHRALVVTLAGGVGAASIAALSVDPILDGIALEGPVLAAAETSLWITVGACLLIVPGSTMMPVLIARGRHGWANLAAIIGRLVQTGAMLIALTVAPSITMTVAIAIAGELGIMALQAIGVWRSAPRPTNTNVEATNLNWRTLAGEGGSFWGINLAVLLNSQVDVLLAALLVGPAGAAIYRLAERVTNYGTVFLKQLSQALVPEIAGAHATDDRDRLRKIFLKASRFTAMLGIWPLVLLATWGDWAITLWIGTDGTEVAWLACIVWVALLISLLQAQAVQQMALTGRHRRVAIAFVTIGVINVVTSVVLGAIAGVWGIAVGTLLTVTIVDVAWLIPSGCRHVGVKMRQYLNAIIGRHTPIAWLFAMILLGARHIGGEPTPILGIGALLAFSVMYVAALIGLVLTTGERRVLASVTVGRLARRRRPRSLQRSPS